MSKNTKEALDLPEGFSVVNDEDFVYLKYKGEIVTIFSSLGATRESIKIAVEEYLNNLTSKYYFCSKKHQVPAAKRDSPCLFCGSLPPHEVFDGKESAVYVRCINCDYETKLRDISDICPKCFTLNPFRRLATGAEA